MNLHEYQGKEILASYGVTIQRGKVATTAAEAVAAAKELTEETGTGWHVIKAQVHAGGRGKGGGVKLAKNLEQVEEIAGQIIGMDLVTPQTSAEGKRVHQVLVAEDVYEPGEVEVEEFYMSVLLDRAQGKNMIMYSTEGGMDIETVAEETPHLIFTETIDASHGLQGFQARRIAFNLGLSGKAFKEMTKFVAALYNAYVGSDSALFEINPVLKASDNRIIAVDCKITLDENALFRHKDLEAMRDTREENATEVEAKAVGLNYVDLDGNVGCMVNGAGLAMATMDLIKQAGGEPANFLDVGGTADAKRVEEAFKIILKDKGVKAILVNIFGGIVRCDRVAQGIIDAKKSMGDAMNVPLIVRLQGTNAEIAKDLIDNSGMDVQSATEFQEAADKVQAVIA
ncbi:MULTISPECIES: ADP-forming succinate--CoA ligase subunit beta [Nonlabens]|uniref:Succinate--CoA ligase [ADP-forming] subunit beta n=2 Tax=Nonlabens ulvanivorans TaxID=906888 RepID=A0A084K026_NONUL|nr:ADP-forming succinate--CoA ligase subunit beta [Nonlabens ulvanivorans]KEZ94560.1 succinyl-CoA synthetase subunit beta [Nonlabens ulvanivorans]PRX12470.1 succinyl-CoA synthetase beta subunit [Nonlabens ulvanivorans]